MAPIDPRLVRARRFPVHAAVDRCNEEEVKRYTYIKMLPSIFGWEVKSSAEKSLPGKKNIFRNFFGRSFVTRIQ